MRPLSLAVFGDGQFLIDSLPASAYGAPGTGVALALGSFVVPAPDGDGGLFDRLRAMRRRWDFEHSVVGYCRNALDEWNPPVLVVVLDASGTSHQRRAFASARTIASECLSVAAMMTGTDTTIVAIVVRSPEDMLQLAHHIGRGHFDALRVGGLTVIDANRLRRALPSQIQAEGLS